MITPLEYVRDCCPACYPPGALFCQVKEDAPVLGWTETEIQEANTEIMKQYNGGARFVFPAGVRYV